MQPPVPKTDLQTVGLLPQLKALAGHVHGQALPSAYSLLAELLDECSVRIPTMADR
jgi:hypothetical protein